MAGWPRQLSLNRMVMKKPPYTRNEAGVHEVDLSLSPLNFVSGRLMVVAHHPGNFPTRVVISPDVGKFRHFY